MRSVDEEIRRAMQEGEFDNLPGKGKPLDLDDNPYVDPAWQMALHVLKSNDFTLPWIESLREIEADLDTARNSLTRAWEWRQASLVAKRPFAEVEGEWKRAKTAFSERIEGINRQIFNYNLEVPLDRFQIHKVVAEREIEKIQASKSKA